MKGVILCGGKGTRLGLSTRVTNKHLLPVFDKPMILYPIETLKKLGVKDILIISGGNHLGSFTDFLSNGSEFGVDITYKVQKEAGGIAHALLLAEKFVGDEQFVVILGDNIFDSTPSIPSGNGIVLAEVENPRRFGVFHDGRIIEKPQIPASKMAVTGIYFYLPEVFGFMKNLKPSPRGEMEITDVNNWCLQNGNTTHQIYQGFWTDAGTPESLLVANNFYGKNQ